MEEITDADYTQARRVCKYFKIENLREYHNLYVQSDTILLADVFNNFGSICLEIYGFDPAYCLAVPGLAWQAALRKIKVKLGVLIDIDILLMVEKGIRGETRHAIHRYVQANNKYMEDYNKYRKSSLLNYWDINNSYG